MTVSRTFVCILIGIAMTLFSWYGPWEWPAWPAFATLHAVFGNGASWQELPYATRGAMLVGLIVINSGFWALAAAGAWALLRRALTPRGISRQSAR